MANFLSKLKDKVKSSKLMSKTRDGVGGLLILFCSGICAFAMINTFAFVRDTTARSVAENTEHIIALHVLASCYTNNVDSFSGTYGEGKSFDGIKANTSFYPLDEFNEIMQTYHLMSSNPNGKSKQMYIEYMKEGKDGSGPTVIVQADRFVCFANSTTTFNLNSESTGGGFQVINSWILPDPSQVVIENN